MSLGLVSWPRLEIVRFQNFRFPPCRWSQAVREDECGECPLLASGSICRMIFSWICIGVIVGDRPIMPEIVRSSSFGQGAAVIVQLMRKFSWIMAVYVALASGLVVVQPRARAIDPGPATYDEPVVVRLVHLDRQAAAVLRLFEGTAAPHPAAALAAWKRSTRDPNQLGKPLEAAISFLNPEMVREWSVFHEASFQLGFHPETGSARWRLTVPGDDGTIAAPITALRLSGGGTEEPVRNGTVAVTRLGGPSAAVAARGAGGVILASSRAEIDQGLQPGFSRPSTRQKAPGLKKAPGLNEEPATLAADIESGLVFRIEPGRLTLPSAGSLATRCAIELCGGLGCRTVLGSVGVFEDRVELEMASELESALPPSPGAGNVTIDQEWLKWIPAGEAVAVASLAVGRGEGYWDAVFALADRIDRADPARAKLVPLRTRINLLASAVGARLEADLWPHLRGVTFGWLANLDQPDHLGRALLVLQMDEERAARQLAEDVLPRLVTLWGKSKVATGPGQPPGDAARRLAEPP